MYRRTPRKLHPSHLMLGLQIHHLRRNLPPVQDNMLTEVASADVGRVEAEAEAAIMHHQPTRFHLTQRSSFPQLIKFLSHCCDGTSASTLFSFMSSHFTPVSLHTGHLVYITIYMHLSIVSCLNPSYCHAICNIGYITFY